MRILFLGDIVGEPGRKVLRAGLARLKAARAIDLVIANAENAAGGSGINPRCFSQLVTTGVQAFTMGDHVFKKKEIYPLFDQGLPICRPANFPAEAHGPDHLIIELPGLPPVGVVCVLGRTFMRPVDCPFRAMDRVLATIGQRAKIIIVDVHAEATSDKQLLARYLAGRVSAVCGTHTHVPTADACILPPGTAYITDVGMTGPYDSIIGRRYQDVLQFAYKFEPTPFEIAEGDKRISGAIMDIDPSTGAAASIELVHLNQAAIDLLPQLAPTGP